jgi:hypothetical protein
MYRGFMKERCFPLGFNSGSLGVMHNPRGNDIHSLENLKKFIFWEFMFIAWE